MSVVVNVNAAWFCLNWKYLSSHDFIQHTYSMWFDTCVNVSANHEVGEKEKTENGVVNGCKSHKVSRRTYASVI